MYKVVAIQKKRKRSFEFSHIERYEDILGVKKTIYFRLINGSKYFVWFPGWGDHSEAADKAFGEIEKK